MEKVKFELNKLADNSEGKHIFKKSKEKKQEFKDEGYGFRSVAEHMPSTWKTRGSTSNTTEEKGRGKRCERGWG